MAPALSCTARKKTKKRVGERLVPLYLHGSLKTAWRELNSLFIRWAQQPLAGKGSRCEALWLTRSLKRQVHTFFSVASHTASDTVHRTYVRMLAPFQRRCSQEKRWLCQPPRSFRADVRGAHLEAIPRGAAQLRQQPRRLFARGLRVADQGPPQRKREQFMLINFSGFYFLLPFFFRVLSVSSGGCGSMLLVGWISRC